MASKNLDVGVKYTGDAKGFKKANDEARREAARLRKEAIQHSKDMEQSFKNVAIVIAKLGAAFIVAQKAVQVFDKAMRTTGEGADTMERMTAKLTAGIDALGRSLVTNDLDNLAQNIKNAMKAAGELADMEDLNDARERDLSLRKSSLESRIRELKVLKQEGTITKEQSNTLKTLSEQLYQTEIDILQSRVDAKVKFAADSRAIDKSIFSDLQEGVIARSKLKEEELKDLANVTQETKAKMEQLRGLYTSVEYFGGEGGGEKTKVETFDKAGYAKDFGDYLKSLSSVQRVQVFEDLFSNEADWIAIIGYWNKINMSMTDYQSNVSMINRSSKGAGVIKEVNPPGITSEMPETEWDMSDSAAALAEINAGLAENEAQTYEMTAALDAYNAKMGLMRDTGMQIAGVFENMLSAGVEGWDEFGKAAVDALKQMIIKLAAMGALYLALTYIPGFAAFMQFVGSLSGFANGNFIPKAVNNVGLKSAAVAVNITGKSYGRDIVYSSARSSNSLGGLT